VSVPAPLSLDNMTFHCLPSANHVLEQSREDVVNARATVSRWGTFEEGER